MDGTALLSKGFVNSTLLHEKKIAAPMTITPSKGLDLKHFKCFLFLVNFEE